MANYYATTRTNYFRADDPELLRSTIEAAAYEVESLKLWSLTGEDDIIRYAFGCYTSIAGAMDEDTFEEFVATLQKCLADGDAIVITEVGYENLRYLEALATIITKEACDTIELTDFAYEKASQMLEDPKWTTSYTY